MARMDSVEVNHDAIRDFRPLAEYRARMISEDCAVAKEAVLQVVDLWSELSTTMSFLSSPQLGP